MPYSVKGFFEIDEDMVQILLVLEVLFTQDSEVEDLFCGASSSSEPCDDLNMENTMLVSLTPSLSGETRNSAGMARLAEPVRSVSG